ncbi:MULTISPECIES: Bug family tripartite tricarboxylate transporter substrate binding protein [Roseinatronobacter]|uniref:Tripartite tricarboxylate transporter substrate-binding protein n=1 Tax=Roseinatronobacter domitianus TaxID=2940293 RepID=A0ABT0M545_9RHOB|nr:MULTISPECIES: tripartite tricarboxylate transporter substrate-binding protein [Roseibaca]MCL1629985.1 tripartite tricarboxylate transporter substrate-binding protein [Roseibaca domitiana]
MTIKYNRRSLLKLTGGTLAAASVASPSILFAQDSYPSRPINVVVPFDTGGYNDRLARAFAPFLSQRLGQPLNIINRGGAGALLGHSYFLQQPDDGYTLLCTSAAPFLPLNVLTQNAPFAVTDFHMMNLPSRDYTMMATSTESGITSIEDVINQLKADPRSLTIGIQPASADLVNLMLLADTVGISRDELRLVTYDGGGPARNAVAGNVVDIALVGGQGFLPLADKIVPLLIFDDAPRDNWGSAIVTEVAPGADFVLGSQRGWGVHASLVEGSPEIYQTILSAVEETSKAPEVIEALSSAQLATDWFGPEVSNRSLLATAAVMEQHLSILQGS